MQKFIFTLLFLSNIVFAIDKVFIREYTYKASDYDSKVTARVNALNQVSELLLREVGVYIKSETKWDQTETKDGIEEIFEQKMDVITAGITKVEIIDEKWNWGEYWVKAKVTLNPKDIKKKIDDLVNNKEKFDQYEKLEKDNNKANAEIERLRKELKNVKSEKEQLELSKSYNKQVDILSAQDWFNKAFDVDGDEEKMIAFFIMATELDPEFAAAFHNLGVTYMRQNKNNKAEENLLKSLELDPENPYAYHNLGLVYINLKKYNEAEEKLLKAIELNYENSGIYNTLGLVCIKLKKYNKAEAYCIKSLELNPEYAFAYLNLGSIAAERDDDYDKMIQYYQKAAQVGHLGIQKWLKDNGHTW